MEVSKNDWKLFRARIGDWQEAYMGRLTKDYIDLLSGDENASDKFWKLEDYDNKYNELSRKLDKCEEEKAIFVECELSQKNIADKMRAIRTKLKDADVLDEFDRVVFESLVEAVIVGEQAEDGIVDPYKLTFVLKRTDERCIPDARDR